MQEIIHLVTDQEIAEAYARHLQSEKEKCATNKWWYMGTALAGVALCLVAYLFG